jgi:hypothetical protein
MDAFVARMPMQFCKRVQATVMHALHQPGEERPISKQFAIAPNENHLVGLRYVNQLRREESWPTHFSERLGQFPAFHQLKGWI